VVLGLLLDPAGSVAQQPRAERRPLPTLTRAHDAHSLTIEQAKRNYPVELNAVVTYYDTNSAFCFRLVWRYLYCPSGLACGSF